MLDGTLEPALARELTGSAVFGVASQARVQETLALMRRPADTRLETEVAREVALRDGEMWPSRQAASRRWATRMLFAWRLGA